MLDPKENRKAHVEMISKSHREGDIQTIAKAVVNLYDHMEELEHSSTRPGKKSTSWNRTSITANDCRRGSFVNISTLPRPSAGRLAQITLPRNGELK